MDFLSKENLAEMTTRLGADLVEMLVASCRSTKIFSKVFLPERFYLPFSKMSDEIFSILDDDTIKKAAILAPRGWGKTSTLNFAYPMKRILFQQNRYIVPISNTATQAVAQSENLKREMISNELIQKIWGPMHSKEFSKEQWVTANKVMVMPRGSGQQVRGLLYGNNRPDLLIADDLEDAESVKSEEQREKLFKWFMADVLNSVNRSRKDWRVIVVGTLLHEDSLLARLQDLSDWKVLTLAICNEQMKSNWPDFMSDQDVLELKKSYRDAGQLDVFYREYMNMPVSEETADFKKDYFRYYASEAGGGGGADIALSEADLLSNRNVESVVIIDPAKTSHVGSCDTAIVGASIDTSTQQIFIRDVEAGQFHPDQQYDKAFSMADRIKARVIGIEVTGLNEFVTYPMKNEMMRRGKFYEIVELHARGKKEDRIASLIPFYRQGLIYHNPTACHQLEGQLMSFPRSKKADVMDAAGYLPQIFESGERYMGPLASAEDEYAELERLDKVGDFRVA
jgi:hypothetical protein